MRKRKLKMSTNNRLIAKFTRAKIRLNGPEKTWTWDIWIIFFCIAGVLISSTMLAIMAVMVMIMNLSISAWSIISLVAMTAIVAAILKV